MREQISRRILTSLRRNPSVAIQKLQLQVLMDMAARGFGMKRKRIRSRNVQDALKEYADYTVQCMTYGKTDPDKLFQEAYKTGSFVRRLCGLKNKRDLEELVFYFYRNINIIMNGELPGEIIVSGCYFSHIYTSQQCAIMSNADSGFISGLLGGGRLQFTERITEGCEACRACFKKGDLS